MRKRSETGEPCLFLEWDSKFFGYRIATVLRPSLHAASMDEVLSWCAEHRIDCLYFLAQADDAASLRLARDRGFRFVDVRMTLDRELQGGGETASSHVRPAEGADVPLLREIAATSHLQSRFWADDRFDRRACAELYATWIERSCRGYADAVWVAEHEGHAAGYLTCHRREGGLGEIGLVAVAPSAKGRGLGRELVARGLEWFRGADCRRASVVTQAANIPAQRLYQAAGFQTSAVEFWHHLWFDAGKAPRA